jgi:hypothetical protein
MPFHERAMRRVLADGLSLRSIAATGRGNP